MKCEGYSFDLQNISFHNILEQSLSRCYTFTVLIPNRYLMKKIYSLLLLGFCLSAFAQEGNQTGNVVNQEISGFKLYPNPATADIVYVSTEQNAIREIRIFDVFGELVLTDRISSKALDISRLSPGIYMVQVTENGKSINRKLVVK